MWTSDRSVGVGEKIFLKKPLGTTAVKGESAVDLPFVVVTPEPISEAVTRDQRLVWPAQPVAEPAWSDGH